MENITPHQVLWYLTNIHQAAAAFHWPNPGTQPCVIVLLFPQCLPTCHAWCAKSRKLSLLAVVPVNTVSFCQECTCLIYALRRPVNSTHQTVSGEACFVIFTSGQTRSVNFQTITIINDPMSIFCYVILLNWYCCFDSSKFCTIKKCWNGPKKYHGCLMNICEL